MEDVDKVIKQAHKLQEYYTGTFYEHVIGSAIDNLKLSLGKEDFASELNYLLSIINKAERDLEEC